MLACERSVIKCSTYLIVATTIMCDFLCGLKDYDNAGNGMASECLFGALE
jgi:hypothetical protein